MSEAVEEQTQARTNVLVAYATLTFIGVAFFWGSFGYDFLQEGEQVGPAYLPRYASALLIVLGVLLVIQELRGRSRLGGDSGADEEASRLTPQTLRKLLTVFVLIAGALAVVPFVGLILALVVLVAILTLVVERMPVIPSLAITAGAAVGSYVIFIVFLSVPLPMGPLEGIL